MQVITCHVTESIHPGCPISAASDHYGEHSNATSSSDTVIGHLFKTSQ